MAIDLRSFKSRLEHGIARKNSYEVWIQDMSEDAQMFCLAAQFPGMTVGIAPAFFQGMELKLRGDKRFPTWTGTFYGQCSSSTIAIYDEMLGWFNSPIDQATNVGKRNPADYWKQVRIVPLADDRTTELGEIVLLDAWINEIQPVDISYQSENELLTFNVILAFSELGKPGVWGTSV